MASVPKKRQDLERYGVTVLYGRDVPDRDPGVEAKQMDAYAFSGRGYPAYIGLNCDKWFDAAGHYASAAAETAEDALRFAARCLDLRESFASFLRKRQGEPRWWVGQAVGEVHRIAMAAVALAIKGEIVDSAAADDAAHFFSPAVVDGALSSISPVLEAALLRACRWPRVDGRIDPKGRASLTCLMATVCERIVSYEMNAGCDARVAAPLPSEPPMVARILEAPERYARDLASFGDADAARVAEVLSAMIALLCNGGADPLAGIVIPQSTRSEDSTTARVEEIASGVAAMGPATSRERAGAAFLFGATAFGLGAGHPRAWADPPTFEAQLGAAMGRAEDDDEDVGIINGREAVLRWRKAMSAGLYALGHNADTMTNTARTNARRRAKAAHAATRGGGTRHHES